MLSNIGINSKSPSLNNLRNGEKVNSNNKLGSVDNGYGSKLKMNNIKANLYFDKSKYARSLSNNRANQVVISKSNNRGNLNGIAKADATRKPSLNKSSTIQDNLKKNFETKYRNRNPKNLLNGTSNQFLLNSYSLKSIDRKTTKTNKNFISPKSIKSSLSNVSKRTNNSILDNSRIRSPVMSNKSKDIINRSDILSHNYNQGNGLRKTMLGKAWNPHPLQMNFKKIRESSNSRPYSVNTTTRSTKLNPKDLFSINSYSNYKNRLFSQSNNKKYSRSNINSNSTVGNNVSITTIANKNKERSIQKSPYNINPIRFKNSSGMGSLSKFSQNFSNKILSTKGKLSNKPSKGNILMKIQKKNDIQVEMAEDQQDYSIKKDKDPGNDLDSFFNIQKEHSNSKIKSAAINEDRSISPVENRDNKFTKKNIYDKKTAKFIFRQNNTSPFMRTKWTRPILNPSQNTKKPKIQAEEPKNIQENKSELKEEKINIVLPKSLINSTYNKSTKLDEPTGSQFIDDLLRNSDIKSLISNTKTIPPKENKSPTSNRKNSPLIKEDLINNKKLRKIKRIKTMTKTGIQDNEEKKNNQDIAIIKENFMGNKNHYFLSVCDGHGYVGHEVSHFIKERLPFNLESLLNEERLDIKSEDKTKLYRVIENAFLKTNNQLNNSEIDSKFSGSTCVSCFLTEDKIISANIGDSRIVLGKKNSLGSWTHVDLSRDHKPSDKDEAIRIKMHGGRIEPFRDEYDEFVGPDRVWLMDEDLPGLAMSRSFGDMVAASVGCVSLPEIKEFHLDEEDKFLILASDGIWEFISSQECINIIKEYYMNDDIDSCCDYLIKESCNRWIFEEGVIDDITLIIIFFE